MTNINFSTFDASIRGGPGLPDEQSGGEKEGQFDALLSTLSVFPDTAAKHFEPPAQSEDMPTENTSTNDLSDNLMALSEDEITVEADTTGIDPYHGGPAEESVPRENRRMSPYVFDGKPPSETPVTGKDVPPITGKAITAAPINNVLPETAEIIMPESSDVSIGSQEPTNESKPELAEMIGPPVQKPQAMFAATGKVPGFVVNNTAPAQMPVETEPILAKPGWRSNLTSNAALHRSETSIYAPLNGKMASTMISEIKPGGGMTVSLPAPLNETAASAEPVNNSMPHVDAAAVAPDGPIIEFPAEVFSAKENTTPILMAAQNLFAGRSMFNEKAAAAFNEIRGRQTLSPHFSRKFVQYADLPGQKVDQGPVLTPPIIMFPGKTGVTDPPLGKGMKQALPVILNDAATPAAETAVDAQEPVHEFHGEIDVPYFYSPGNEAISPEDKLIKGPDLPFEKFSLSKERHFDSGRISDVIIGKFALNADKSIKNFGGDLHAGINPFAGKIEKSILEVVEVMQENGKPSLLTLKLNPSELGEIEIRIEKLVGGHIKIEFHTENDQVKNILQQNFDQLRESMKDSGYQADKIDVFSRTSAENSNSQNPRDGNHRNNNSNAFNQTNSDELTDDSLFEPASKPDPKERLVSLRA